MTTLKGNWKTQLASDIIRDGVGLELINPSGLVVAEIFRSDKTKTVQVNTFSNDIPLPIFQLYIEEACVRLDPFEDGTSLAAAKT